MNKLTIKVIIFSLSTFFLMVLLNSCSPATVKQHADKKGLIFGVAVRPSDMLIPERAEILSKNFNLIVAENTMKLQYLRPTKRFWNWGDTDLMLEFAQKNKMKLKGHTFVWHQQNSPFISNLNTREEAVAVLTETITETLTRYKGKFYEYDVCNEIIDDNGILRDSVWMRTIGPEYIDIAFKTAREADPSVKLLLNDYSNEYAGTVKGDAFYELVKGIVERGVPIDGVGLQLHMIAKNPLDEHALRETIKRFRDLGLSVSFTEVDVRIQGPVTPEKEVEQEEFYKKLLTIAMDEPNVKSFIVWGYTDAQSWIPGTFPGYESAHLYDRSFEPKPVYNSIAKMITSRGKK